MMALAATCSAAASITLLAMLNLHFAMGSLGPSTRCCFCEARQVPLPEQKYDKPIATQTVSTQANFCMLPVCTSHEASQMLINALRTGTLSQHAVCQSTSRETARLRVLQLGSSCDQRDERSNVTKFVMIQGRSFC